MPATISILDRLKSCAPAAVVRENEPLAKRTTMRVGGCADVFVEPASEAELSVVVKCCRTEEMPFMLLGRGSNLLILDHGIRGVVIHLAHAAFSQVEVCGSDIRAGAGAKLKAVSAKAREHLIGGLEFLEGIPGSVGGALRMNAGAMGSATFERLTQVRFMNAAGQIGERNVADVPVEYRSCALFKDHIALGATFRGTPDSREAITKRAGDYNQKRWTTQPKEPSAGCIFRNPSPQLSAGKLIEELGLKGTRRGGAAISTVHGNFIVNEGAATAADVLELIALIKERAKSERGVELREEVEIIGE